MFIKRLITNDLFPIQYMCYSSSRKKHKLNGCDCTADQCLCILTDSSSLSGSVSSIMNSILYLLLCLKNRIIKLLIC